MGSRCALLCSTRSGLAHAVSPLPKTGLVLWALARRRAGTGGLEKGVSSTMRYSLSLLLCLALCGCLVLCGCRSEEPSLPLPVPMVPPPAPVEREPDGARLPRATVLERARTIFQKNKGGKEPIAWEKTDVEARFVPGEKPYWIVFRLSDSSSQVSGPSVVIDDTTGKAEWKRGG